VGSIEKRLEALERAERERVVERVRDFWHSLAVEECALLAAYGNAQRTGADPPPGAEDLAEHHHTTEIDEALGRAIGWHEGMADEEAHARVGHLMREVDPFAGRYEAVRRRYMELIA
jgi:hypothetical protein